MCVPDHPFAFGLFEELNEPLLTTTLQLPGDELALTESWEIQDRLEDQIELILDAGHCGVEPTTIIDMTGEMPELVRTGRGPLGILGWIVNDRKPDSDDCDSCVTRYFAITLHEAARMVMQHVILRPNPPGN